MRTLELADYEIIEAIVKAQLQHYNLITPPKIEGQSIYVRRIKKADTLIEGKIYKVEKEGRDYYTIVNDNGKYFDYSKVFFDIVSEQEYTAQQEPKESKAERWQPSYGSKYWYIGINDGQFFVADFHWGNDDVDFTNHNTGNCFPTKAKAKEAADKIKQLLKTL